MTKGRKEGRKKERKKERERATNAQAVWQRHSGNEGNLQWVHGLRYGREV